MNEECAIIGYYCINNQEQCIPDVISSLENLQHRGRESSGISFMNNNNEWGLKRGVGLVKDIYKTYNYNNEVKSVIGHNRYSTSGKINKPIIKYEEDADKIQDAEENNIQDVEEDKYCKIQIQPFHDSSEPFSLVHNGTIQGISYENNDSLDLFNSIKHYVSNKYTMKSILMNVLHTKKGIYNLIIQTNDGLYLVRDRFGVRPFYYGYKTENIVVCGSETIGFGNNVTGVEEVLPGEIIYIGENKQIIPYETKKQKVIHKLYRLGEKHLNPSFCIFEYFYFMNHNSKIKNQTLYDIRFKLGSILAKNDIKELFTQDESVVVGSPNSGIAAGEGYALYSGFNYKQCIRKKENVGRTFILPTDTERKEAISKAFDIDVDEIKDKILIIVDDTIVRGNTFKSLIEDIRFLGKPKKIHVRIASPRIVDSCHLGIDLPTKEELVVNKTENICEYIGADSIKFLTLEEIKKNIGSEICTKICGCFENGIKYTDW